MRTMVHVANRFNGFQKSFSQAEVFGTSLIRNNVSFSQFPTRIVFMSLTATCRANASHVLSFCDMFNASTAWTCFLNVSIFHHFLDTFSNVETIMIFRHD